MATTREANNISKKQLAQRELLWPGSEPWLRHRKSNKGFATIPKTMPLILQIMDDLSNGKPVSSTYLGLWCATWDNSMVNVSKHQEMAHAAGFTGQRATYTWAGRIKILQDLKFIDVKAGRSGPISHVLLWNPHRVIRWHQGGKTPGLVEANFNALLERALDIGANDMLDSGPPAPPAPTPAPAPPSSGSAPAASSQAAGAGMSHDCVMQQTRFAGRQQNLPATSRRRSTIASNPSRRANGEALRIEHAI